ncbi:hypothetical protein CD351_13165 [Erythrobacter sp. KY5]|nr:hypothetical protein CD351_13165 [Erythrobacter sp. KY5]
MIAAFVLAGKQNGPLSYTACNRYGDRVTTRADLLANRSQTMLQVPENTSAVFALDRVTCGPLLGAGEGS